MLTIILSILYWCMPKNKTLGAAAIGFSLVGFLIVLFLMPVLSVFDLIFLVINIAVYSSKDKPKQ